MQLNRELFKQRFNDIRVEAKCLCGRNQGFAIGSTDRYGIEIVPFFCTACGHIYTKYRLSERDLEQF